MDAAEPTVNFVVVTIAFRCRRMANPKGTNAGKKNALGARAKKNAANEVEVAESGSLLGCVLVLLHGFINS